MALEFGEKETRNRIVVRVKVNKYHKNYHFKLIPFEFCSQKLIQSFYAAQIPFGLSMLEISAEGTQEKLVN